MAKWRGVAQDPEPITQVQVRVLSNVRRCVAITASGHQCINGVGEPLDPGVMDTTSSRRGKIVEIDGKQVPLCTAHFSIWAKET